MQCVQAPSVGLGLGLVAAACGGVELPCDILEEDCQRAVLERTAEMRGVPAGDFPQIFRMTRERYTELVTQGASEAPARSEIDQALALLGLIPVDRRLEDVDGEVSASGVGAFYLPGREQIVIIEGDDRDWARENRLLSHEFAHLFQDRSFGIEFGTVDTTDGITGYRSLIEGDATFTGDSLYVEIEGLGVELDEVYRSWRDDVVSELGSRDWRYAQWILPYPVGALPFASGAGRSALFGTAQRSFAAWLAGEPQRPRSQPLGCVPPAPPPGWRLVVADRLGVGSVLALTLSQETALRLADDRLAVYGGPSGEAAAVWILSIPDDEAREQVAFNLRRAGIVHQVEQGTQLRVSVGSEARVASRFAELGCSSESVFAAIEAEERYVGGVVSDGWVQEVSHGGARKSLGHATAISCTSYK